MSTELATIDGSDQMIEFLSTADMNTLISSAHSVFDVPDPVQRSVAISLFLNRAEELGNKSLIAKIFAECSKAEKAREIKLMKQERILENEIDGCVHSIVYDGKGVPLCTIDNFAHIMEFDSFYDDIKYNTLANIAERHEVDRIKNTVKITKWNDTEEALSRRYIEQRYGIYSDKKHADALRILFNNRKYNPVYDIISSVKWDGTSRCEEFLTKWAGASDTAYTRECSRLIFAGGIWRLMLPGCKLDDVIVLVGKQGAGKSSLVRFLAINDSFFGTIKTIEGDKSTEQLSGKWICEIEELAALTRSKEVEAVKAFITRQKDSYRKPYDRNPEDRPRSCVFIGTTNNPNFLIDLTGNRRFYPVKVNLVGYDLFDHEEECREYIAQCWAEAFELYKQNKMPNFANRALTEEYKREQDLATQDDWRIGAIESYLQDKPKGAFVCVKEIMTDVISADPEHPINPTPKDSKEISLIVNQVEGWEKSESRRYTPKYGQQRGWIKVADIEDIIDRPESNDYSLPF